MRSEMIYVQVQVNLKYEKGKRASAVRAAKAVVSKACKDEGFYGDSYWAKSNGKIRERVKS